MPKTATVTIGLTVTAEVPKSWTEDDLFAKVAEAIEVSVKATTKRVPVIDADGNVLRGGLERI